MSASKCAAFFCATRACAIILGYIAAFATPFAIPRQQGQHASTVKSESALNAPLLRLSSSVEATIEPAVSTADICSSASLPTFPDPEVVAENLSMHAEAVRKSEETFYGYYPEGFAEFQLDKSPSEWTCYSLDTRSIGGSGSGPIDDVSAGAPKLGSGVSSSIWDSLANLDTRVVPPPFQPTDLARVSNSPILTPDECNSIINECEAHYWGWGTSNERYGTPSHRVGHMIKLEDLSYTYTLVNFDLLPRLFPAIASAFPSIGISPENLRLGGCRVVKYDASEGRVELGMHRDGLLVTANIALNDRSRYEGGGTVVEGVDGAVRLSSGHALLHPGDVMHGGAPITSGVRYVLVCFVLDATVVPHEKYCQDRMTRDVEAARAIPIDDAARSEEREGLLRSATRHCADAYAFGRMSCGGVDCDGYDGIVESFSRRYLCSSV